MDYVVLGIGFGATLLVLGLLTRDFGSRLRFRSPAGADGVFHAEELVARVSWSRFCGALGTVWATAGLAFVVITVVCMLLTVPDARAGWVMSVSFLVLLVAMAFWTWAYFDRFGSYGILPERDMVVERPAIERVPTSPKDEAQEETRDQDRHGVSASRGSIDEPERVVKDRTGSDDAAPTARADPEPENVTNALSQPTPEERLTSAATSSMDHDAHEADLDAPAQSNSRPQRQAFRPAPEKRAPSDTLADTTDSAESGSDEQQDADAPPIGEPGSKSVPISDVRPREA